MTRHGAVTSTADLLDINREYLAWYDATSGRWLATPLGRDGFKITEIGGASVELVSGAPLAGNRHPRESPDQNQPWYSSPLV